MWTGLNPEEGLELGRRTLIPTKQVVDLTPGSQPTREHQHTCEQQRRQRIRNPGRVAWVGDAREEMREAAKEVLDRCDKRSQQSVLGLCISVRVGWRIGNA
jgi:hypothetical protein